MHKKLQIFVSSTYEDLKDERQAAVEAILRAGHIPAGMELFCAGSEAQLDVIRRWIDESDVYMLIMGGRYGSVEPKSGLSYTEVEYKYAVSRNMPLFAVVMSAAGLHTKMAKQGAVVGESLSDAPYKSFKTTVLARMVRHVDDAKDIKIGVMESLAELQRRHEFSGWIAGSDIPNVRTIAEASAKLVEENSKLKAELEKLRVNGKNGKQPRDFDGLSFDELVNILSAKTVAIPEKLAKAKDHEMRILDLFVNNQNAFATGIENRFNMGDSANFLFYKVAPDLITFGLVEREKLPRSIQRLHTSKLGRAFLIEYRKRITDADGAKLDEPEKAPKKKGASK